MSLEHILETVTILCFGAAWPMSIYKSWKARSAKGKSLQFLLVILLGYVAGVAKCFLSKNGVPLLLTCVYILNACMVSIDTIFYFRNSALDRQNEK